MTTIDFTAQLRDSLKPYYYQKQLGRNITHNVAARRKELSMTQVQLAEATKMKQPQIARLERVSYASHSISSLCKIAVALDTTVEALLATPPDAKESQ